MNLVYLSPNFPPNYFQFCDRLAKTGGCVLGIGEAPSEELRPELGSALLDYYQVRSLENYDEVLRACGYFIHEHGRLDRVESHNEHWLIHEGRLREDFNMIGPKIEETCKLKRKSLMKKVFSSVGVNSAPGEMFIDKNSTIAFIQKHGYPIIAKPDIGVGAWATYKIGDEHELDEFLKTKPDVDFFIEKFVDGELYTFDGLTNQNGDIVYYTSHYSTTGVFELVAYNVDLNFYSLREIPADVVELGMKSIKAFCVKEKFFHLEFFRQKTDGALYALEINCRPPGGFITDMMNFAADIDVYQEWANILMFNKFQAAVDRKYHCAHIARRNGKSYKLSHEDVCSKYGDKIVMISELSPIFSPVMGNLAYIVRSPSKEDVIKMIHEVQETI